MLVSGFFFPFNFLQAQDLFPYKQNNLWGYKNTSGKVIVPPRYDSASTGILNLYLIKSGGGFGVLGPRGEELLPPNFEQVWFGEELRWGGAIVGLKNRRYTILDDKGTFLLRADRLEAMVRGSKYMFVKDGERWAIVSGKGEWLAKLKTRPIHVYEDGSYCLLKKRRANYYSAQGKFRFKTKTNKGYATSSLEFRNGIAPITIEKREWRLCLRAAFRKYYLVRYEGDGQYIKRRMKPVEIMTRKYHNVIDTNGRYFLPNGFSISDGPKDGYAIAYSPKGNGGYGIVGQDRSFVVPPIYDKIERTSEGNYRLTKKDEQKVISLPKVERP